MQSTGNPPNGITPSTAAYAEVRGDRNLVETILDIEANHCNNNREIRIINDYSEEIAFPYHSDWLRSYQHVSVTDLITDINRYFLMVIRSQMENTGSERDQQPSQVSLHQRDANYTRGCLLSNLLKKIKEEDLLKILDPSVFVSLANTLAMHASLELNIDMRTISLNYSNSIAYQIGTSIYKYSDLTNYSLTRTDQVTLLL